MFRDGSFLQIGWPSITVFSSSDYKRVALTDYDRFPEDIDGEGDGFSLASKRTTTFMSAGMTLAESSPGREITDVKWRRGLFDGVGHRDGGRPRHHAGKRDDDDPPPTRYCRR